MPISESEQLCENICMASIKGHDQWATRKYQELLASNPSERLFVCTAGFVKTHIALKQNKFILAQQLIVELRELLSPDSDQVLYLSLLVKSKMALIYGDYDAAQSYACRAADINDQSVMARSLQKYAVAKMYAAEEYLAEAWMYCEQALQIAPDFKEAQILGSYVTGMQCLQGGHLGPALECSRLARHRYPRNLSIMQLRLDVFIAAKWSVSASRLAKKSMAEMKKQCQLLCVYMRQLLASGPVTGRSLKYCAVTLANLEGLVTPIMKVAFEMPMPKWYCASVPDMEWRRLKGQMQKAYLDFSELLGQQGLHEDARKALCTARSHLPRVDVGANVRVSCSVFAVASRRRVPPVGLGRQLLRDKMDHLAPVRP